MIAKSSGAKVGTIISEVLVGATKAFEVSKQSLPHGDTGVGSVSSWVLCSVSVCSCSCPRSWWYAQQRCVGTASGEV